MHCVSSVILWTLSSKFTTTLPLQTLQLMEVGPVGVYGQLVASFVDLGHKLEHGAARSHGLSMAGRHALERQQSSEDVTHTLVQVRN